jgi:hypothetical protein
VSYWALAHSQGTVEAIEADRYYFHHGWTQFTIDNEVVLTLSPGFDGYFTPLTEEQYLLGKQEAEDEANG